MSSFVFFLYCMSFALQSYEQKSMKQVTKPFTMRILVVYIICEGNSGVKS